MKSKFAKALANNITIIAGNVAHIALIDAGIIPIEGRPPSRPDACAKIKECEENIASLLQEPGLFRND